MRIMLCEAILFPFDAFARLNRSETNSTDQLQFYKLPVMGNEEEKKTAFYITFIITREEYALNLDAN